MATTTKLYAQILALTTILRPSHAALYHPTPQIHFLEHILVDNSGAHASNFSSAITPCSNYVTEIGPPAAVSGRTTAAQWMRVAFHDFVTANVSAGTGGLDASIGFETLRAENSGSAFNDSFTFWRPFVNDAVSMADLIAVGTVMSMALCGGHTIPYRPGRLDAPAADTTTGVPAPESDLATTLLFFARSGFAPADAIGLTACGHTMGSVHAGGFPDVVPASAVTATNTNGGADFDASRAVFDGSVVREYVDATGNRGGPLVTTDNVTTRSDLRLYESDGNATMRALYDAGEGGFQDRCVELMGRMIHTVPAGVELGGAISPLAVKPVNTTFDFDENGDLTVSGKIRVLAPSTGYGVSSQISAWITCTDTVQVPLTLSLEPDAGVSVYGTTAYYAFSQTLLERNTGTSYASIRVTGSEEHTFELQSQIFVVPSMTQRNGSRLDVTIASKDPTASITVDVAVPTGQQGTLGPRIVRQEVNVTKTTAATVHGYQLWQASVDLDLQATGAVAVSVIASGQVQDVLYLDSGVAGW